MNIWYLPNMWQLFKSNISISESSVTYGTALNFLPGGVGGGSEWEHLIIIITTNNCMDHLLTLKGYVLHFDMTTKNCLFTIP